MIFWRQVASGLGIASAVLAAVFALRIYRERLHRVYPVLFTFLLFDASRSVASLAFRPGTSKAAYFFIATEPLAWILNFMMVREIFHIVLREHPGIDSVSRSFVRYALAVSAAASAALLWMDYKPAPGITQMLQGTFEFGRVALLAVTVLLVAGVLFMSWFPVTITRNASVLLTGYAVYFGSKALLLLIRNMTGTSFNMAGGIAVMCVFMTCLVAGTLLLKASREELRQKYRTRSTPEETERLLAQLERINRKLEESTKR